MTKGPWIDVIADGSASPELQALYDELRDPRGHVDNILSIHSLHPASLRTHVAMYREAMTGSRDLSRAQREMIAVVASAANGCEYWLRHHTAGLGRLLRDHDLARCIAEDHETAPIEAGDRAMLAYVARLTRRPEAIGEADVRRLRDHGFSDRAVLDIVLVTGYYAYVNRLAQGLGVPLEEFWTDGT